MTIATNRFTRYRWGLESWEYRDTPPPPIESPPATVGGSGELLGHWGEHVVPRSALAPPDLSRVRARHRPSRGAFGRSPRRDAMCERNLAPLTAQTAHRVLVLCSRAEDALVREMARTLHRLRDLDAWGAFGLTRLEDYARERLGISRRWAQQLIRLDRTLEHAEPLRRAFHDGRLSVSKVLALAPLADAVGKTIDGVDIPEKALDDWIARAPTTSVRVLRSALTESWTWLDYERDDHPSILELVEAGVPFDSQPILEDVEVETSDRVRVSMRVPAPVRLLHEITVDTARAMSGHGLAEGQAVEMMLADHVARHGLPDERVASDRVHRPPPSADIDAFRHDPRYEPRQCDSQPPVEDVLDTVRLIDALAGADIPEVPRNLDRHLRRLVRARQRRRAEMQRVLRHVRRHRLFRVLGYQTFASYCERVLGIARRTAEEMVALDEAFAALPETERAFADGRITAEKAKRLVHVATADTERAWLERATLVTARYFRCEVESALDRREAGGGAPLPLPLSTLPPYAMGSPVRPGAALESVIERDAAARVAADTPIDDGRGEGARTCAHAGAGGALDPGRDLDRDLDRDPGDPRDPGVPDRDPRDASLGTLATSIPTGSALEPRWMVRFTLPREVHDVFLTVDVDIARRHPGSTRWQRYLALLVEVLEAWNAESDEARRRTATYKTLERDGFMCAVPGCTQRLGLESHHVVFRSRGGCDDQWNRISICSSHHRLAIHGKWSVRVTGGAPATLSWDMGSETYVGDVRTSAVPTSAVCTSAVSWSAVRTSTVPAATTSCTRSTSTARTTECVSGPMAPAGPPHAIPHHCPTTAFSVHRL